MKTPFAPLFCIVGGCLLLSNCARSRAHYEAIQAQRLQPSNTVVNQDPQEKRNRRIFKLNMALDALIARPAAEIYRHVIPSIFRRGIDNALDNLKGITTVANDMLQVNFSAAASDTWRFVINSTLGLAGFYDVATPMGLPAHTETFGLTLSKWSGGKPSVYVVQPFFGPSTGANSVGSYFDLLAFSYWPYLKPKGLKYTFLVLTNLNQREQLLDANLILDTAIDPYVFVRDAYLQKDNALIKFNQTAKGPVSPPPPSGFDEFS